MSARVTPEAVGYSSRQAVRLVEQGLDCVDFFGVANCVGGDWRG